MCFPGIIATICPFRTIFCNNPREIAEFYGVNARGSGRVISGRLDSGAVVMSKGEGKGERKGKSKAKSDGDGEMMTGR